MAEPHSSVPPRPPKESLTGRYKLVWRVLFISNLALGAYMFARPKKKYVDVENNHKALEKRVKESKAEEEVDLSTIKTVEDIEFELF